MRETSLPRRRRVCHYNRDSFPRDLLFTTADDENECVEGKVQLNFNTMVDNLPHRSLTKLSASRCDFALFIFSLFLVCLCLSNFNLIESSTIELARPASLNSPANELASSSIVSPLQSIRDRSRRQYDAPLDSAGYNNRINQRTNAWMRQRYPPPPPAPFQFGGPPPYSPYGGGSMDVCAEGSCYPSTGDLLIGREHQLNATSTCGLSRPERFCVVSYLDGPIKCFYCDSRKPFDAPDMQLAEMLANHRVENIVRRLSPIQAKYDPNNVNVNGEGNTLKTWYQSENGVEHVSIHLELEAEFHFTHLIITFRTFRPAAMLVERSQDRGKTWKVYRYFAQDCAESFPGIPTRQPESINDIVCESRYSMVEPSSGGEVIFNAIPDRFQEAVTKDPYAAEVQDQLKITDLRINFTKLHTFGDNLWEGRSETDQKYYYAIEEMDVRGRCSCYGHASRCKPGYGEPAVPYKVHGQCDCRHNTTGRNCERCKEFYNDAPWRPAVGQATHECRQCNCNEHADRCHFDESVYIASGNVSGGVCDQCLHHTVGTNCEQCEQTYYQNPSRSMKDVDACIACDCHPAGSLNNGICDTITDLDRNLVAGQCHCKPNVGGQHCDRCKDGYYDLQVDRPDGCLACNCSLLGTVNNLGCDKHTGECVCKRNVVGEQCDRCAVGHYGLMNNYTDGCLQCDCDEGGAFDNNCDMATGQCRCRPHAVGRRCDMPEQGYFAPWLDHLRSEAEQSQLSPNAYNETREGFGAERPTTWTGAGFIRALEASQFQFPLDNVPYSTDYNLLLRYELFGRDSFKDVDIEIVRPPADPNELGAVCDNQQSAVNYVRTDLPANQQYKLVEQPVCLEQGKNYTVIVRFPPQQWRRTQEQQTQDPRQDQFSVSVDSVSLIPRTQELQIFQSQRGQRARDTFERFRCLDSQMRVVKDQMHEQCRDVLKSLSFFVHGGALRCECDPTGSESNVCKPLGGQCSCKKHVAGRMCDHCAVGYYGFGPNGCEQCDCDPLGSQDNFCDALSGQCECRPNAYGRRCNQCQPGFWGYPNCRACQCYGRAETCDADTGRCLNCRENTGGGNCEICADGFYGDPRNGVPCRPCPCPGGTEGPNHAAQCRLDEYGHVMCYCEPGYAQPNCGECQFGYFGSPALRGGSCQRCDCSGNADIQQPGVCDLRTGQCLKCLFHTEGFHCERCAQGYYGAAVNGSCQPCSCNILGSDHRLGECNRVSGQCPCLPNVEGRDCDRCTENHWKLASGEGCEACNCSPEGSLARSCNEFNGQCQCKQNRGGRTCGDCIELHWGNPEIECFPCKCNPEGSATLQCNRNNGTCICKPGITGPLCNQCARGFNGTVPNCQPCGECFDNWDVIVQGLKEETQRMVKQVKRIMEKGVSGAFDDDFRRIENDLQQVEEILVRTNISESQFTSINEQLADMRTQRSDLSDRLDALTEKVRKTSRRVEDAALNLDNLRSDVNDLSGQADLLERNATALQEANVEGALNLTRDASERSDRAQAQVGQTTSIIHESELLREEARRRMQNAELELHGGGGGELTNTGANSNVANVIRDLRQLEKQLPDIDAQICGRGSDQEQLLGTRNENVNDVDRLLDEEDTAELSCDPICGGAGCGGRCGGVACVTGAVTRASDALRLAHNASTQIQNIMDDAKDLLNELQQVQRTSEAAHLRSQVASEAAERARNVSSDIRGRLDKLLREVTEVAERDAATPAQVRTLADEVRKVTIDLSPEEIDSLARRINETIQTLNNVNAIIAETEGDLARTEQLLNRAQVARNQAQLVQRTANNVTDALTAAKQAQNSADAAITRATDAIQQARRDLATTETETNDADQVVDRAHEQARRMNDQFNLDDRFVENAFRLEKVQAETNMADSDAQTAETDAEELQRKFEDARILMAQKSGSARRDRNGQAVAQRAEAIKQRAQQVRAATLSITTQLEKMTEEFSDHERTMDGLQEHLRQLEQRMADSLEVIQQREEFYGQCTS